MKPEFGEKYFDNLMPSLIKSLDDGVERVASHTLACLTNLFEDFPDVTRIEQYIGDMLPKMLLHLQSGRTWKQENAVAALASLATNEGCLGPNLTSMVEAVSQTVEQCKGKPTHTQLLSQCFETLSMVLSQQPKGEVAHYLSGFTEQLYHCRKNMSTSYFLAAWNRLCHAFDNFAPLDQFFPEILSLTKTMAIDASDEDIEGALDAISQTFKSFGPATAGYSEEVYQLAFDIVDKEYSHDTK